jgi:hypothetical protein
MKRTLTALGAALLVTGAAHAATTELVLYKADHFHGPAQSIKGEVANIENGFGHEASSMIARGGAWEVCTADHFKGRCRAIAEGEYPTLGWLNDRIVSVRFLGANARVSRADEERRWSRGEGNREASRMDDERRWSRAEEDARATRREDDNGRWSRNDDNRYTPQPAPSPDERRWRY